MYGAADDVLPDTRGSVQHLSNEMERLKRSRAADAASSAPAAAHSLDAGTQRFAIVAFLVVATLTTIFSYMAAHAPRDRPTSGEVPYPRGNCSYVRPFTMWRNGQQQQQDGCPARGATRPCPNGTDAECALGIRRSCLYGDAALLVCDVADRVCGLRTYAVPSSLERPAAGVCPLSDQCGDPLTAAAQADMALLQRQPVFCASPAQCRLVGVRCKNMSVVG